MKSIGSAGPSTIPIPLLLLLLLLNLAAAKSLVSENAASMNRDFLDRRIERALAEISSGTAPAPSPTGGRRTQSRVFHVTDYGADPTGNKDSTAEIAKAISDAFNVSSNGVLMPGIKDLGGVELHLDGGSYLISAPLALPPQGGNMKIHSGSLRASPAFPEDGYLIELRSPSPSSSYDYEYVTLRDLMLDSGLRGGGVAVVNSLRTTIDNCYVVHFASDGVLIKGGHETMVRGCFVGQHITAGGDPGERNFSGTGISIEGNDNAVTDTVVFSAGTGIAVSGQANVLTGVHCYNKATGFGGTGIHLRLPSLTQTRIVGCYMDFTGIVAEDPVQLVVANSFFLGDANVVLRSVNGKMGDVVVVDNVFSGGGRGKDVVELDERGGRFVDVEGVVVDRNGGNGMVVRSTLGKRVVKANGTRWEVDFDADLLFRDRIRHVAYSLQVEEGFFRHALRNVTGNRVVVETDAVVDATLFVQVDQMAGSKA